MIKPEKQDSNLAQIVKQLKWASQTVNRHGGSLLSQWVFTSDNKNSKKFISHSWFAKISISFWMRVWFSENMIFYNFSIFPLSHLKIKLQMMIVHDFLSSIYRSNALMHCFKVQRCIPINWDQKPVEIV